MSEDDSNQKRDKAGDTVRMDGCEFLVRRTRRGKVFEAAVNTNLPVVS